MPHKTRVTRGRSSANGGTLEPHPSEVPGVFSLEH